MDHLRAVIYSLKFTDLSCLFAEERVNGEAGWTPMRLD